MAHVDNINIHHAEDCTARAVECNGTEWLSVEFRKDDGERLHRFRVDIFMDFDRAQRLAAAINAAWPEPQAEADPVITWPRPSYHVQARGVPSPAMQAEDMLLPCATLAALNGDDTPDEAA